MTKAKRLWLLGQLERQRKLRRVASMEDLVEGQGSRGPNPRGIVVRFWERVIKRGEDDCWEWEGTFANTGYGEISACNTHFLAHRMSFLIHHGKIDPDLLIMHSCDNRKCVNPGHLLQGTDLDNVRDAVKKGRMPRGETAWMAKLTEANVIAIRIGYASGKETMKKLAEEFGVQIPCISKIVYGERWKHIPIKPCP